MNSARRTYDMTSRAAAAERTGQGILDAFTGLFLERPFARISLGDVAARAGVSVQTVIRRFGDKEGLVAAASARGAEEVGRQRGTAVPGDVPGGVDVLLEHYAQFGHLAMRMVADEGASPALAEATRRGRALHRDWCDRVFAPYLVGLDDDVRRRRLAELVTICDVQTWHLLHHVSALEGRELRLALLEMLIPLTTGRS